MQMCGTCRYQLSKMLEEVAVDVHGVKGRHKHEIWWWHKLWKINTSLKEVLFLLLSFFLFVVWCLLQKQLFNRWSLVSKGWKGGRMHRAFVYSSAPWVLENWTISSIGWIFLVAFFSPPPPNLIKHVRWNIWANYNDVSRRHPKWWFNKGTSPKSP